MASSPPSPTPTMDGGDDSQSDYTGIALAYTAGIGGVVFLVCFIVFTFLRKRLPQIYEYRAALAARSNLDDYNGVPVGHPDLPPPGVFSWIPATLRVSDDELFQHCGLDATMYLRLIRFGLIVFSAVTLVTFVILVPLYGTGPNKDRNQPGTDSEEPFGLKRTTGVDIVSLANLTNDSTRIWAAWVIDGLILYLTLYLLFREVRIYGRYRRIFRAQDRPSNYSILVYDVPRPHRSDDDVATFFEAHFPGQVAAARVLNKAGPVNKYKNEFMRAVTRREVALWRVANDDSLRGERPVYAKPMGCCRTGPEVDALEHWRAEQERLAEEIAERQAAKSPDDVAPSSQAVIMFTTKRTAYFAAQTQIWKHGHRWKVDLCPEPTEVVWSSITRSRLMGPLLQLHTYTWLLLFLIFWTPVTVAVLALANLTELSRRAPFEWLAPILEWSPAVTAFIEGVLPPVLLVVLNQLPLILLQVFCNLERHSSITDGSIKFRTLGYIFQFVQVFLLVVLSGTFLKNFDLLLDVSFSGVIDLLANAVPKQAPLFINYVLNLVFIGRGVQLVQLPRLLLRGLLGLFAKTERQKRNIMIGSQFIYGIHYIVALLVFTISMIYSTIAPLICFFACVFYAVTYVVHRYNLAFALKNPGDGGGRAFAGAISIILFALCFKQLMMIGVFGIFKRPIAAILGVVNFPVIFVFWWNVRYRHEHIFTFGALSSLASFGAKEAICPVSYTDLYRHPGEVPLEPVEDLSGVHEFVDIDALDHDPEKLESHDNEGMDESEDTVR